MPPSTHILNCPWRGNLHVSQKGPQKDQPLQRLGESHPGSGGMCLARHCHAAVVLVFSSGCGVDRGGAVHQGQMLAPHVGDRSGRENDENSSHQGATVSRENPAVRVWSVWKIGGRGVRPPEADALHCCQKLFSQRAFVTFPDLRHRVQTFIFSLPSSVCTVMRWIFGLNTLLVRLIA